MALPRPDESTSESPLNQILDKHGAKISIHGGKNTKFREMAEDLHRQLETEKHRTAVVQNNLNAILNQYQVTSSSVKQLQASQEQTAATLHVLQEQFAATVRGLQNGQAEDTDPHGE